MREHENSLRRPPVHPHMRGEYARRFKTAPKCNGSSPHAWRICGRTCSARHSNTVHPHMRGEYSAHTIRFHWTGGSSPHAWRIFMISLPSLRRPPVHPHMRGEYWVGGGCCGAGCGSSPHAWRIFSKQVNCFWDSRFIPTCVENIRCHGFRCNTASVHPHMRGEYGRLIDDMTFYVGSSPHAWRI